MTTSRDPLDALLAVDQAQLTNLGWWRVAALGSLGVAVLCASLALVLWWTRPAIVPLVQMVQVDTEGVARQVRLVPMTAYTPADWQWIGMLRQWVLHLRWKGLDLRQTQLAWEWLKWHACGEAMEQLQRYAALDEPFEHLGVRKREVLDINISPGDIPGLWTVLWREVYVNGTLPAVQTQQSVSFAVARRTVTAEMAQVNGFGLCVKKFGALKP